MCFNISSFFIRWDPKKRMTPDEAVHHEWLQPSGQSSSTFIITSSSSSNGLLKPSREQLKENADQQQQQYMQKYQRSQPITPLTSHLPQIKTPSNRGAVSLRYTKDNNNRVKGSYLN